MTFTEQIYALVRRIPAGRVATYGLIALWAGRPRSARAVGAAMSRCPYADVPCHRVLNARGELAPFPAFGTGDGQRLLLEMEGRGPDKRYPNKITSEMQTHCRSEVPDGQEIFKN